MGIFNKKNSKDVGVGYESINDIIKNEPSEEPVCAPADCMPQNPENDQCWQQVWVAPIIDIEEKIITVRPPWSEFIYHEPVWEESTETVTCNNGGRWEHNDDCKALCWTESETETEVPIYSLVEEGWCEEIQHPEETTIVECQIVIEPGYYEWRLIDCSEPQKGKMNEK
jgi:hypothetical protein